MRKILLSILASIYRYRLLQPQQVWHKHRAWGLGPGAGGAGTGSGVWAEQYALDR